MLLGVAHTWIRAASGHALVLTDKREVAKTRGSGMARPPHTHAVLTYALLLAPKPDDVPYTARLCPPHDAMAYNARHSRPYNAMTYNARPCLSHHAMLYNASFSSVHHPLSHLAYPPPPPCSPPALAPPAPPRRAPPRPHTPSSSITLFLPGLLPHTAAVILSSCSFALPPLPRLPPARPTATANQLTRRAVVRCRFNCAANHTVSAEHHIST